MKSLGRISIQTATQATGTTVVRADLRPLGIDPQGQHTLAQPAL